MSIENGLNDTVTLGPLFDAELGAKERDAGIDRATAPMIRQARLHDARKVAREIAALHGEVCADDVARHFRDRGIDLWQALGNAAGSIFRSAEFEFVRYQKSERVRSHRNVIAVWRLRRDRMDV